MRIERMIAAVLVSVLALIVVQGTASASGDGMPYNSPAQVQQR
jgi:type IV secretory pathway VirB2 component (pilin)